VRLGWVLEPDSDAAARGGVKDDLFGPVVEVVDPQAAAGEVARGVREHACGSTPGIAAYPRHRGIPQVSQRQVGLAEGLRESSCSFWTDLVAPQTASTGVEAGVKKCSTGVDMKANTHSGGGGALELGDLRLLEDGSERGGALGSDIVALEPARQGRMETERE
jgi:hypothetical protein